MSRKMKTLVLGMVLIPVAVFACRGFDSARKRDQTASAPSAPSVGKSEPTVAAKMTTVTTPAVEPPVIAAPLPPPATQQAETQPAVSVVAPPTVVPLIAKVEQDQLVAEAEAKKAKALAEQVEAESRIAKARAEIAKSEANLAEATAKKAKAVAEQVEAEAEAQKADAAAKKAKASVAVPPDLDNGSGEKVQLVDFRVMGDRYSHGDVSGGREYKGFAPMPHLVLGASYGGELSKQIWSFTSWVKGFVVYKVDGREVPVVQGSPTPTSDIFQFAYDGSLKYSGRCLTTDQQYGALISVGIDPAGNEKAKCVPVELSGSYAGMYPVTVHSPTGNGFATAMVFLGNDGRLHYGVPPGMNGSVAFGVEPRELSHTTECWEIPRDVRLPAVRKPRFSNQENAANHNFNGCY